MPGTAIFPVHKSRRMLLARGKRFTPHRMTPIKLPSEAHSDAVNQIAMSIFADCTNAGLPFQDSIVAVYLSGLHHGSEAANPQEPSHDD